MESGRPPKPPDPGDDEPSSGLDVQGTAALDRLTRWAAKALRVPVALVTVLENGSQIVASSTVAGARSDSPRLMDFSDRVVRTGQPHAIAEARDEHSGGDGVSFLGAPLVDGSGAIVGSFCVMDARPRRWTIQDIELVSELTTSAMTELDLHAARAEAAREKSWSDRQQAVLELIAARAPLTRTLTELLNAAEAHAPDMLGAMLLVERVRGQPDRLRFVAGRSLPRAFTNAIDGLEVGRGICGTAARRGEPVVVSDVLTDPLTSSHAEVFTNHGLRSGWSSPVLSGGGTVLGTFALFYRTARGPDPRDQVVVDRAVHLARLAIEQADGAKALRRNVTRAQSLAREQTALQRVATRVAGETDPQALFSLVAEQVGRLLKAEAGYVLAFEDAARYRNVGSWARGEQRLLPSDAVAEYATEGLSAQLRRGRSARRVSVESASDALGFEHRIAAPVLVDGKAWGMVVALRDTSQFPRDDEKRIVRFAQLASVAVANAHAHEQLATQARTDSLTGLANRRAFDERLAEETERAHRHTRTLSVMLVDVDHFKTINDRFGHAAGDRVLVNLADNLRSVMRSGDLLARLGGDEMAMILPDCRAEQAALVAQRMLAAIGEDSSLARRHAVTLSAGVAGLAVGHSADDLLRCADQALYRAKDEGRNQVVSYESDMPDRAGLRLSA